MFDADVYYMLRGYLSDYLFPGDSCFALGAIVTYEQLAEVNGLAARRAVLLGFARSRQLDAKEQAELCRIKDRFKELGVQVPGETA